MKNKLTALLIFAFASIPSVAPIASARAIGIGVNATATLNVGVSGVGVGVGAGAGISVRLAARIQKAKSRVDQEVARRITALNDLLARINAMVKLTSDEKGSLSATIQGQITAMNTLQTQIATDAAADATSSLRADIRSITKTYRVFILIIPQGALDVAADRVQNIAGEMTALAGQLQTRITAAQTAGANMSASVSALANMNTKLADANVQANAAITEIANLKMDNGDRTVMASNTAALKNARGKVQAAQQDLVAARKDAGAIVKALIALKVSGTASASSTTSASTTP